MAVEFSLIYVIFRFMSEKASPIHLSLQLAVMLGVEYIMIALTVNFPHTRRMIEVILRWFCCSKIKIELLQLIVNLNVMWLIYGCNL